MPLYLGLDSSTQSLTASVIEVEGSARRVVLERTLKLSDAFPIYRTKNGVIVGRDHREVTAPPLMWAAALDLMLGELATTLGPDLSRIRAVSASAQQHGTVYLGADWTTRLATLNHRRLLAPQLRGIFTRRQSPIWMDSSTTAQCESITKALGGAARVAELTGSRETERFSGPQIRKMCERHAEAYDKTVRIHLVSSFIGALLVGRDGPIDAADASGMNLMDLRARAWSPEALKATARWLGRKLPQIVASDASIGEVSNFWQKRYHFPAARVIASSGDNPCSLIGLGLITPGDRALSLGTSDTMFCAMHEPTVDPSGSGNVFVSPTGEYMSLLAWRNGSLARDRVRTAFELTWDQFSAKLRETPPGNNGALMLPWFEPEITPPAPAVVTRHKLASGDAGANVRGVVEGQALSMLIHSRWMGKPPKRIRATGGGSANRDALQVVADVFGAEVVRQEGTNAAALGAALRAMHGDQLARGEPMSWDEVVAGFSDPSPEPPILPRKDLGKMYQRMAKEMEGLIAEV